VRIGFILLLSEREKQKGKGKGKERKNRKSYSLLIKSKLISIKTQQQQQQQQHCIDSCLYFTLHSTTLLIYPFFNEQRTTTIMMISNKNMFVSFLFSSAILISLGPNLGITSSSSLPSYVVNAEFTCNTELDFHTWENEKEQRNIPGKQTFEQIATILLETFDEAYSDSHVRMISDTFASVSLFVCSSMFFVIVCLSKV
jgi:hypothetical protein